MSESNAVQIKYVAEATIGATPVDSTAWKDLRFISDTLSGTTQVKASDESRVDRNVSDQYVTGVTTSGGISCEVHASTYSDFIQAAMCGTAASGVTKIGLTDRSFTIEKEFTDLSGFKALTFTGMRVSTAELKFSYGSAVTADFSFAGLVSAVSGGTTLVGSGSSTAMNTNVVMQSGGNLGGLQVDGASTGIVFKDISVKIDNSMRAVNGVGSNFAQDQKKGRALVTGNINMYLDDAAWLFLAHSLDQTDFSVGFNVTDGTNTIAILLPKLNITGALPSRPGPDADVMFNGSYTALYDATEATSLKITES